MAKRGEIALQTKILRATKSKGFTLVEILIVIGLIALISAVAIPSMSFILKTSPEALAKQMSGLLKEARDRSLLSGNIVRLHLDLDKQQYWLEESPGYMLMPSAAEQALIEKERSKDPKKEKSDGFRLLREITKEKRDMPRGLKIDSVISPRNPIPTSEGDAYVYFLPHGGAENSIIHILDEDGGKETIYLQAVTGITKYKPGFLQLEDL